MKAYEASTKSLATILQNPLLSADRVEKTTEDLAVQLANQREVDDAIRIGGAVAVGAAGEMVDDDELEKELEGLVKEEKELQERKRQDAEQKVLAEKQKSEETEQKMMEERLRRSAQPSTKVPALDTESTKSEAVGATKPTLESTDKDWENQYAAAQSREKEERARADTERLKREEKRIAETS